VHAYLADNDAESAYRRAPAPSGRPTITHARVLPAASNDAVQVDLAILTNVACALSIDLRLTDVLGNPVGYGSLGAYVEREKVSLRPGENRVHFEILTDRLATGQYVGGIDLNNPEVEYYDRVDNCIKFEVIRQLTERRARVLLQAWGHGSYELPMRYCGSE